MVLFGLIISFLLGINSSAESIPVQSLDDSVVPVGLIDTSDDSAPVSVIDVDSYVTDLTDHEAAVKIEQINAEREAALQAQREEEERLRKQTEQAALAEKLVYKTVVYSSGGYYLNTQGIPMSDMKIPDYVQFGPDGLPVNYSSYYDGKATAYYCGTTTSTGTAVHQGSVAVNPRMIPYGTEMYIVSLDGQYVYGWCRAEDTGGFIYMSNGPTVDLYMSSYDDCVQWGVRGVRIYFF